MTDQTQPDPTRAAEALGEEVAGFRRFIDELAEPALVEKVWGPKEVLAHLVFWIESYVAQTKALLAGESPDPPAGRFNDLNAQAVRASRGVPVNELLLRHRAACEWLCECVQAHDPENIVLMLKRGSSIRRPLTWYLVAEASHIRDHRQMLARQTRRDPAREAEKVRRAVEAFCHFIEELPASDLVEGTWGPKEVLAHLTFWHERHVAQIEACLAKEPFEGPQGRVKALNAQAVQASRGVPVTALLGRFWAANERLCDLTLTLDPQNVILKMKLAYDLRTLDNVMTTITAHVRDHHQKLARVLKQRPYK